MIESINELNNMQLTVKINTQQQAEDAISKGRYIIGSVDQYASFSIAENPTVHVSDVSATSEAKRLASMNPGKTFVVMILSRGYRAGGLLEF